MMRKGTEIFCAARTARAKGPEMIGVAGAESRVAAMLTRPPGLVIFSGLRKSSRASASSSTSMVMDLVFEERQEIGGAMIFRSRGRSRCAAAFGTDAVADRLGGEEIHALHLVAAPFFLGVFDQAQADAGHVNARAAESRQADGRGPVAAVAARASACPQQAQQGDHAPRRSDRAQ